MKVVDNIRMCDDCGDKPAAIISLSMNQMVFGGFPVRYRGRCQTCENKAGIRIEKKLDNIDRTP